MAERLQVDEPARLLPYLIARLGGWGRNTLRDRLRTGCVHVNGEPVRRHDHQLRPGDSIELRSRAAGSEVGGTVSGRAPLYLDDDLVAIDKPAGLLAVSTDREKTRTALSITRESLSRAGRPARLWPVHRLDRETSGVLLFARSMEVCEAVRARWTEAEKVYLAVVEGHLDPASGVIHAPLWEDRNLRVRVGPHEAAKDARTHFTTLSTDRDHSLLEVRLDTGRRHQIRAHLAHLGHPIVGDERYGHAGPSLALHSLRLTIPHPRETGVLVFEAPVPPRFAAFR
ncbi:MAG: pseudouridine synthase [Planctomycetota bacterium]